MRASELLAARVVDESGRKLGQVIDVRVDPSDWRLAGLVVARGWLGRLARPWGDAEGRMQGPAVFRVLTAPARSRLMFVSADRIAAWRIGEVRLRAGTANLPSLADELAC